MSTRAFPSPVGLLVSGAVVAFVACGGLRDQTIIIDDEAEAGTGDTGSGGSGNASGSGGGPTSSAGVTSSDGGLGGDGDGIGELPMGGAPSVDGPPTVLKVTPADAAASILPSTAVRLDFSEALDEATVTSESIRLLDGDRAVPGKLTYQAGAVLFEPDVELSLLSKYTVEVATSVTDKGGVPLEAVFRSSFAVRDGVWHEETSFAADSTSVWTARVATDARGNSLVVWLDNNDSVYARWYYAGQDRWGDITPIESRSMACRLPAVAVSPEGDAVVSFFVNSSDTDQQIWARRFVDGQWEASEIQLKELPAKTTFDAPAKLSFKGDRVLAAWIRRTVITGTTVGLIDAAEATGSGAWTVHEQLEYAAQPSKTVGAQLSLTSDSAGNAMVIYAFRTGTNPWYPTFMRYSAPTGNGGGTWTPPSALRQGTLPAIGDNSSYYSPNIAMNDAGEAFTSWITKNASNFDIVAARFTKAGGWEAPIQLEMADGNAFQAPGNIAELSGGFTVVWKQEVGGSVFNGYRATYSKTGKAFSEPELLSSGSTNVWFGAPAIESDPHGNAIAAWEEGYEDAPDITFSRYDALANAWSEPATLTRLTDTGYSEVWLGGGNNGWAAAALGTYADGGWTGFRVALFH